MTEKEAKDKLKEIANEFIDNIDIDFDDKKRRYSITISTIGVIDFNNNCPPYRKNRPTLETVDEKYKEWKNRKNEFHREDGPAVIWPGGNTDWYYDGHHYNNIEDWIEDHPDQEKATKAKLEWKS